MRFLARRSGPAATLAIAAVWLTHLHPATGQEPDNYRHGRLHPAKTPYQGIISLQLENRGQIWYRDVNVKNLDKLVGIST